MRKEAALLNEIRRLWPVSGGHPSPALSRIVIGALINYPRSSKLWTIRGDLYQLEYIENLKHQKLSGDRKAKPMIEIINCYIKAFLFDSKAAEPLEELGFLYYSLSDDIDAAEFAFRQALALKNFTRAH